MYEGASRNFELSCTSSNFLCSLVCEEFFRVCRRRVLFECLPHRSACCWRGLDRDAEVDRTKKIANKNVWTTFVKAAEVNARVSCGHRA